MLVAVELVEATSTSITPVYLYQIKYKNVFRMRPYCFDIKMGNFEERSLTMPLAAAASYSVTVTARRILDVGLQKSGEGNFVILIILQLG